VKIHIHLTPVLTVSLLYAGGWFAFWMFAFRPAPGPSTVPVARPEFIRLVADSETLRKLKAPTLFALPSDEGFSGRFLETRVDIHLSLEKPASPVRYLPHEDIPASGINQTLLTAETTLPQSALPIPGTIPSEPVRPADGPQLFLSPELTLRAGNTPQLNIASAGLPETIRVNLSVRPDGTVGHALFEMPVTNAALLSAVRQLHFKPAAEPTESWIDIRAAQEGKK